MYYYAMIDDTGICYSFYQQEEPYSDPYYIEVDAIDYDMLFRKKYNRETQVWEDLLPSEEYPDRASRSFTHKDTAGVMHWLNNYINGMKQEMSNLSPSNHNHDESYAAANHTHADKADLVNGKVPVSQIPDEFKEIRIAANIAARNAMTGLFPGLSVYVVDATADSTVTSGGAFYMYTGEAWIKTAEAESMDVVLQWANIIGKPESLPANGGNADTVDGKHASDFMLSNATEIMETGKDLNDFQTAGIYVFAQAYTPTNIPAGTNGWLIVLPWQTGSETVKQIWLRYGVVGSTDFEIYVRTKIGAENVWGAWSKLYTTSNPPTAAEVGAISKSIQPVRDNGGCEFSFAASEDVDILATINSLPLGLHTIYSAAGNTGNPKTVESWRFLVHKTNPDIGWVQAFGSWGSFYINYLAGDNNYKGWRCVVDAAPTALWNGENNGTGGYIMNASHTVTPSKPLSMCRNGWVLLWADYDPDTNQFNNYDFCASVIPKRKPDNTEWSGQAHICALASYLKNQSPYDLETIRVKTVHVHDTKLVGHAANTADGRNDIVLRAVYEF